MTVLNGEVPLGNISKATDARLSLSLSRHTVDYWLSARFAENPKHGFAMRHLVKTYLSAYPYNLPVEAGFQAKAGAAIRSYKNDLYYRVHVRPRTLDFGNLINTEVDDLVVWNANFEPVFMSALSTVSQPGVTVAFPNGVSAPYTVKPNEELILTVTAHISGPPAIDADFSLTIDGIAYPVHVGGRRILLWPFPPNWKSPVDDSFVFSSWALRSADGHVQSGSRWGNQPRRELSYNILLERDDAARADNLLFGWQSRFYGVVCWPDRSKTTAPVVAGSRLIQCDTTYRSFSVGGFVVLYKDSTTYESAEIETVSAGAVTVTSDLKANWPVNTRVYPVFAGLINASLSGIRHTDGVVEMPVSFECEPSTTYGNTPIGGATPMYRGEELFLGKLNWVSPITFQFDSDREMIDFNTGKFYSFSESQFTPQTKDHNWFIIGRAQAAEFRAWLGRREGVARPVYMPTGNTDLSLITDMLVGASSIDVQDTEYASLVAAHPARRDIVVIMRNGTYHARRITGAETIPGGMRVYLDQPWASTIPMSAVKRISFLSLFRQVGNKSTIRWVTDDKGTANVMLVTDRTD